MKLHIILLLAVAIKGDYAFSQLTIYNIKNYGAIGDGQTKNTIAIQMAIDAASKNGGGRVLVPRGRFVTGVLYFKDNVELNIHEEAVLLATTDRADYGPSMKASALLVAAHANNISITGKGLIDGQSDLLIKDIYEKLRAGKLEDSEWKEYNAWHQRRPSENNRPKIITFENCEGVTVKNISIQNGSDWIQDYNKCTNVLIDSMHVFSNTFINNDGIDIVDCKKVSITNCNINVADDGICLKSSDRNSRCEDVFVSNCKVRSSASALKLGTASRGGFKNILIKNIEIYDTYRSAIAIEAVDGGIIDGVNIHNVNAVNTGNAIFIRLGHRNKDTVISQLKNIHISRIKVQVPAGKPDKDYPMDGPELPYASSYTKPSAAQTDPPMYDMAIDTKVVIPPHNVFPSSVMGMPGHPIENVVFDSIEIVYEGGGSKDRAYVSIDSLSTIPESENVYPEFSMFGELPAWGFFSRHVDGLTLRNFTVRYQKADFRPAIVFDNVKGIRLEKINIPTAKNLPVIVINKSKTVSVKNIQLPVRDKGAIQTVL